MSRRRKFAASSKPPAPPVAALSALHVDGIQLVRQDGSTWSGIVVTAFRAWQWFMESRDNDLHPFVEWCRASGVSGIRALGMYWAEPGQGIGKFDPRNYGGSWGRLRAFGEWLNSEGLLLHFTCGADHQTEQLKTIDMEDFYKRSVQALDGLAAVVDVGNELPKNGIDPPQFAMPSAATLVQSKGSGLGDQLPPLPPWPGNAVSCFHPNRDDFPRRWGKSLLDIRAGDTSTGESIKGCIILDETIGIGEQDEPGRTSANPWALWQATAWSVMAGAGFVNAHIRSAINGLDVPGPIGDECVRAMVDAARRIPQTFALGEYQRGRSPWEPQNPELPFLHFDSEDITGPDGTFYPGNRIHGAKRSFCLWNGDEGLFIAIEPMPQWTPETMLKPGVSILERWGYAGQVETVYRVRR